MNINEKFYRKKSPEAIAHESTVAHYLLFYDKDMKYVEEHEKTQAGIEMELAATAALIKHYEETAKAVKDYVR